MTSSEHCFEVRVPHPTSLQTRPIMSCSGWGHSGVLCNRAVRRLFRRHMFAVLSGKGSLRLFSRIYLGSGTFIRPKHLDSPDYPIRDGDKNAVPPCHYPEMQQCQDKRNLKKCIKKNKNMQCVPFPRSGPCTTLVPVLYFGRSRHGKDYVC